MEKLAILGGSACIGDVPEELFKWPIVTREDEDAVLDVLRKGTMSNTDITQKFEKEFAKWIGTDYAVGYCNGTMALEAAMFACGLKAGDELICQSKTYWASCIQTFKFGATINFCDIDKDTLCMDPDDFERRITPRTRVVMVVHYLSHPAEMDRIMAIAKKHNILVIEDVSHAQGGLYKGKKLGTFGDISAMSLMSGKSFAVGEMGIVVTSNKELRDRALAYGHYDRNDESNIDTDYLKKYFSMPLGGLKGRVNQLSSAMGLVQLKYYDERCAEIRKAMYYFASLISDIPCVQMIIANEKEGSNNAGFYATHAIYHPEKLGGLSLERFCEALQSEGFPTYPGGNTPLHTHPFFKDSNDFGNIKPNRIAFCNNDIMTCSPDLPITESIKIFSLPWFKKYIPECIEQYANAIKKVVLSYEELLEGDTVQNEEETGRWSFTHPKKKK